MSTVTYKLVDTSNKTLIEHEDRRRLRVLARRRYRQEYMIDKLYVIKSNADEDIASKKPTPSSKISKTTSKASKNTSKDRERSKTINEVNKNAKTKQKDRPGKTVSETLFDN